MQGKKSAGPAERAVAVNRCQIDQDIQSSVVAVAVVVQGNLSLEPVMAVAVLESPWAEAGTVA